LHNTNSTYPVNSIAKEIFWAETYRGRIIFLGPRYIGDDFFFRADRSLGAKQEGLTIVHFLNKFSSTLTQNPGSAPDSCDANVERHRKMRAKQQHVCKEMNQYMINTNRKWIKD
jgi:hypothetical protein